MQGLFSFSGCCVAPSHHTPKSFCTAKINRCICMPCCCNPHTRSQALHHHCTLPSLPTHTLEARVGVVLIGSDFNLGLFFLMGLKPVVNKINRFNKLCKYCQRVRDGETFCEFSFPLKVKRIILVYYNFNQILIAFEIITISYDQGHIQNVCTEAYAINHLPV